MPTPEPEGKILSIPVAGPLRSFVEERMNARGFSTVSEYVRSLIHADQDRAVRERFEAKVLEAIDRGEYLEGNEEFRDRLRELARGER